MKLENKKIALVIDWLDTMGGAEELLLVLHKMFPKAPIYTSVYDKERMVKFADCDVRTTYMQKLLPKFIRYKHVLWPVLRAHAFRQLNLNQFDLVISVSGAEAKAVKTRADAVHICYCNTPTRYYWSHYEEFKKEFNFGLLTPVIRPFIPLFVRWMRKWDLEAAARVDYFIGNSTEVSKRIKKYYQRDSETIFPPVDVEKFQNKEFSVADSKRSGYIMWGRHVPYKRFDLAIQACNELKLPLTIVGSGADTARLKKLAGPTIKFTGRVSDEELVCLVHKHAAFLFPGEEDFGIAPVEAIAAGLPVIAYKAGGALDYVIEGKTGLFFNNQTVDSLKAVLQKIEKERFQPKNLTKTAQYFSKTKFAEKINLMISRAI